MTIRCHKLGQIMTEPKKTKIVYYINDVEITTAKANKLIDEAIKNNNLTLLNNLKSKEVEVENNGLSETAKTYLRDLWLQDTYGYKEPSTPSVEMLKGLMCEADSMSLVQDVLGGAFRVKNLETFKADALAGTPDCILPDCVEDIKTSWSLRTFYEADGTNSAYFWQAVGYMMLTGKTAYRLIYCLVPTPEELMQREFSKLEYAYGRNNQHPHYIQAVEQLKRNNDLITSLPKEKRIKVFNFELSEADITAVTNKLKKAEQFFNTISL